MERIGVWLGVDWRGRRHDHGGSSGQLHGAHRRRRGHVVVAGIGDHRDGVGPWREDKRFREHPLARLRGYGGHRVYAPFSASLRDRCSPRGLRVDRRLIERPEDLANPSTLIGEGDLDVDLRLRDGGVGGRGHKGHQRREGVAGGRGLAGGDGWCGRGRGRWRRAGEMDRDVSLVRRRPGRAGHRRPR